MPIEFIFENPEKVNSSATLGASPKTPTKEEIILSTKRNIHITIRMSKEQKERIRKETERYGCKSYAVYVRDQIANPFFVTTEMTDEEYEILSLQLKNKGDEINHMAIIANSENYIHPVWYNTTISCLRETLIKFKDLIRWSELEVESPTIVAHEEKKCELGIWLSKDERDHLDKMVSKTFLSREEFVRKAVDKCFIFEAPTKNPFFKDCLRQLAFILNNLKQISSIAQRNELDDAERYEENYLDIRSMYRKLKTIPQWIS